MSATPVTLKAVQSEVSAQTAKSSEAEVKRCEDLILSYSRQLAKEKDITGIRTLVESIRSFYDLVGKARASKLIRDIVEHALTIDQGVGPALDHGKKEKIDLLTNCIGWATSNKREFLRRSLQARLIRLYNDIRDFTNAQKLAQDLSKELKKLEDRELLIEVSVEESKSSFNLNNLAKAKTALLTAKTNTNSAFASPQLQASVDMQSGVLYSAEERDYKTSFSYFYEAFEGFASIGDKINATSALKYMILCKIMLNETEQLAGLLAAKEIVAYQKSPRIIAIRSMADAFRKRSLKDFVKALAEHKIELVEDKVVAVHSQNLERNMLEKEISRVIEPYSEIELSYIARVIGMTVPPVERAIARMILDKKLMGSIDQHGDTVVVYPKADAANQFTRSLKTIRELTKTVDVSYSRTKHFK
ncbi:putative 26S proteasome regulatory subunit rpn-6.2 [Caenorhabditis elegans]|uniref:Probable 26S proteasome regulatory subunit rpn-6.2 n=2 Tax=Caenorhabditis elegans TaxID=6239 RepID=PS11B_CAEEL|nr:putative 26S proteasome regulatory subunit rpn-6.2 [Caenorhabditis elegans]P34481.3 RecName: Full=Probable 26S proteasome regulatory subunit rpn-6.2 [Caenorhabditis elegans]CAX51679.1 Probable 26S proteasome regulatory subunit rpn-6.2 [Caenorhabditis elegans]|eukprot:NP_001254972.1 Probable 26S proteasome regulatory subunit rpn-6.2 [Caenorhabditis elegans]